MYTAKLAWKIDEIPALYLTADGLAPGHSDGAGHWRTDANPYDTAGEALAAIQEHCAAIWTAQARRMLAASAEIVVCRHGEAVAKYPLA